MISNPEKQKKPWKILTNFWFFFWKFSFFQYLKVLKKEIQYFRGPRRILARNRGSEEWWNLFLGESRSEKRSRTSRIEGRGIPRAIPNSYQQRYEIKSHPWTILWFRILRIFSVENINRLGVFMVQTWDNIRLCIDSQYSVADYCLSKFNI